MALQSVPGAPLVQVGVNPYVIRSLPVVTSTTLDAANEAIIFLGHVVTSDGASHTIDTTGSSSLQWRSGAVTFANGGTTVKIGLAAVLATAGPPGRAANAADVITFDVNAAPVGGGGGITANAWQTNVPTAGTKTVANGDYIAFAIQMTARGGGADSIVVSNQSTSQTVHRPLVTSFTAAAYAAVTALPNCIIVFSDGALGYFYASDVASTFNTKTWNTTGGVDEYGQLFNLPFPCSIYGLYGFADFDNDCNIILYSDPLGTPVAEKTTAIDLNTVAGTASRMFTVLFATPYSYTPNSDIGAVYSPGAASVTVPYKTLDSDTHRIADVWGTKGYGIQRAVTGAGSFSDTNSSLDHFYIGLLVKAFEHPVQPAYQLGII